MSWPLWFWYDDTPRFYPHRCTHDHCPGFDFGSDLIPQRRILPSLTEDLVKATATGGTKGNKIWQHYMHLCALLSLYLNYLNAMHTQFLIWIQTSCTHMCNLLQWIPANKLNHCLFVKRLVVPALQNLHLDALWMALTASELYSSLYSRFKVKRWNVPFLRQIWGAFISRATKSKQCCLRPRNKRGKYVSCR